MPVTWTLELLTVALMLASAGGYVAGVRAAWRQGGTGATFRRWHVASFCGGMLTLAIALISPIARLADVLFSVHMTQHEILMLVAAPLLVIGQPLLAMLWAVPGGRRARVAHAFRQPAVVRAWQWLTAPLVVFLVHGVALWIWHVPVLFEWALHNEAVHAAQHASFVITAGLFWWGMVHGQYGRAGYGVGVLYVFLTALHSTVLGALLTVAPATWYRSYEVTAAQHRIDALADQQLAGLLMWVPSGVIFILIGLALVAAWLGESERRVRLGSTAARPRQEREMRCRSALLLLGLVVGAGGCGSRDAERSREEAVTLTGGDPDKGVAAISRYGCGSCHQIPGLRAARGTVGPPLGGVARRTYIAGQLPNSPANLMRWLQHPQHVEPGTAMPEMGVTESDARDITAYLYMLR